MDICVDFDGTCVSHEFPLVGNDINSVNVLKKLINNGHNLILFTMRSNKLSHHLDDAVDWFNKNNIPLYGINTNPMQSIWTNSPKAEAKLYIDDCGLGCPLKYDSNISNRPFVDWYKVELMLIENGIIND